MLFKKKKSAHNVFQLEAKGGEILFEPQFNWIWPWLTHLAFPKESILGQQDMGDNNETKKVSKLIERCHHFPLIALLMTSLIHVCEYRMPRQ